VELERRVAFVWFLQSHVSPGKKYTEENLKLFVLKYTSFFPDLLKFVFLEGDKFQIYVILTAPRPSRITLARVNGGGGGGGGKLSVSCPSLCVILA